MLRCRIVYGANCAYRQFNALWHANKVVLRIALIRHHTVDVLRTNQRLLDGEKIERK